MRNPLQVGQLHPPQPCLRSDGLKLLHLERHCRVLGRLLYLSVLEALLCVGGGENGWEYAMVTKVENRKTVGETLLIDSG